MYDLVKNLKNRNKILIIVAEEGLVIVKKKFSINNYQSVEVINSLKEEFASLEEGENLYLVNTSTNKDYSIKSLEDIEKIIL